jgi:hypothetical protein
MNTFNPNWILPSYSGSRKFFSNNAKIVPASNFAQSTSDPTQVHNKVIIARLLSLTSPDRGLMAGRMIATSSKSLAPVRGKRVIAAIPPYSLLLIFADYYDPPNCIGIFLDSKHAFQLLWGNDCANASKVKVGDMFAIKDPKTGFDQLGDSIYIIRQPKHIAGIVSQGWPTCEIRSSSEANQQVYFDQLNKIIDVQGAELLVGGGKYPNCMCYTCDRLFPCKGCFGKSPTKKPIVLECSVYVQDCPNYDDTTKLAEFERFTSLTFTSLFFQSIVDLSRQHPKAITDRYDEVQNSVNEIVRYVNAHGGWRVVGWHRRGVITDTESGDAILSERTQGHLTVLCPTDMNLETTDEFKAMQISTPFDFTTPTNEFTTTTTSQTTTHTPPTAFTSFTSEPTSNTSKQVSPSSTKTPPSNKDNLDDDSTAFQNDDNDDIDHDDDSNVMPKLQHIDFEQEQSDTMSNTLTHNNTTLTGKILQHATELPNRLSGHKRHRKKKEK